MEDEIHKWVPRKKIDVSDVENVVVIRFEDEEYKRRIKNEN